MHTHRHKDTQTHRHTDRDRDTDTDTDTHIHTQARTHARTSKIKFFNENIRSNKDSGQIERNKLKYLHYLNKMIEKCKMKKFIFSEVSCF